MNNNKDDIEITSEEYLDDFEKSFKNHFYNNITKKNQYLSDDDIFKLSLMVIKTLKNNDLLKDIETNFYNESIEEHYIYISLNDNFSNNIINQLTNYISIKLLNGYEIDIFKIISEINFKEEENKIEIISDFSVKEYDFENMDNDLEIQYIEDYLKIKQNYPLTSVEMEKLSKKQKRYLLYKLNKNNQ